MWEFGNDFLLLKAHLLSSSYKSLTFAMCYGFIVTLQANTQIIDDNKKKVCFLNIPEKCIF
jgi:hypothetical protein